MKLLFIGLCLFVTSLGSLVLAQDQSSERSQNVVILLGPPGSGKGTQALRLTKELGIPHISTGDLFRENMGENTELGKRARTFIDAGKLVPDELVLDMLFDRISRPDCSKGYLLDGFPRTIPQAQAFDKHLHSHVKLVVVNLDVPDELILKRITGRFTCKECGTIYNKYFSAPKKENTCDKCTGELHQRSDDKEEVVLERLRVYHAQTQPLINFYSKQGVLITLDGTQSPDEVYSNLTRAIKDRLFP